jgi:hypothetical protein
MGKGPAHPNLARRLCPSPRGYGSGIPSKSTLPGRASANATRMYGDPPFISWCPLKSCLCRNGIHDLTIQMPSGVTEDWQYDD